MFRRRTKGVNRSLIPLTSVNRGSDITAPDNTSLIVNQSKQLSSSDDEVLSIRSLLEDEENCNKVRRTASLMNSMSQRVQSTPKSQSSQQCSSKDSANKTKSLLSKTPEKRISKEKTHKKAVITKKESNSVFLRILKECGATEIEGDGSFILAEDQAVFSRKLQAELEKDNMLDSFYDSMVDYLKDPDKVKKIVIFTQTAPDCELARGPVQEPMERLLLLVDCLQSRFIALLMEKIRAILKDGNDCQLISAILRQLRCLIRVNNTTFGAELFELIKLSSSEVQKEIISLLPELITEEEIQSTASNLVDLLNEGSDLTPVVIDSLSSLPLSSNTTSKVRNDVLSQLDKCPKAYLPSMVQFAIKRCEISHMLEVVEHLRNHLPFTIRHVENRNLSQVTQTKKQAFERDSYIRQTFENLKFSVMASKHLTDAFLKAISGITSSENFKPIDFMMIVLIHGYVVGRKPVCVTLLKNKIRNGILLDSHVQQIFKILRFVIAENHKELLDLCSSLLKSFETAVADFGIAVYMEAFSGFSSFLRLDVISDVLLHINTGTPVTVQNGINLLTRLKNSHPKDIEEYAMCLNSTIEKIQDLDLMQVRQLVDVIASVVTAPSQDDSGLVDDLLIFVRKQMSAWQPETQKKGVIASLMVVKHAAIRAATDPTGSSNDLFECDFLLKMALGSHCSNSQRQGFFYDELAKAMKEITKLPLFLTKWHERIYNQLSTDVFVTNIDFGCDYFPMSLQYSIEDEDKLVFPIVQFVVDGSKDNRLHPTIIPSAVRLLWCSEKDLNRITPMLCASVILPDSSVFDKFLDFQVHEQKLIMDCLFLCANYFIECVNALSTQKTSAKLVIRLKQLIEVRKLIQKHIRQIPAYTPPIFQFHNQPPRHTVKKAGEPQKKKRGKKRKSDGTEVPAEVNESHVDPLPSTSTAAPSQAIAQVTQMEDSGDLAAYNGCFRDLFSHAFRLLRMELKLNPTKIFKKKKMSDLISCDVSWSYRPEDKPELGPSDAVYLLDCYMQKSEQILREKPPFLVKKSTVYMSESISPSIFLLGSIKILPKLRLKVDLVSSYCKDLLEACDGIWDAPGMFPQSSSDIKLTFIALLKIIADILSWKGFQHPSNRSTLREALRVFSQISPSSNTQVSISSLAQNAVNYFTNLIETVPLLSGGVSLIRALQACVHHILPQDRVNVVGESCEMLLKRPWFTINGAIDKGTVYNQQIDSLLRTYFASADDRLAAVYNAAEISSEEVSNLTSKDATLPTFNSISKANFPFMYRAICEALVSAASDELAKKKEDNENSIAVWSIVTRTLLLLIEVAKANSSRTNLASLLKRCQAIIQLFLSKGVPVMESALRIKSEEVLKVLKALQATTRFLHSVCCHSKITNDTVVAAHVPTIRSLCERLTLEVKGILILNKIPLDCITIAVLKNRDIQGNDILSQTTLATSEDDSEMPLEDDEENVDIPDVDVDVEIGMSEDSSDE